MQALDVSKTVMGSCLACKIYKIATPCVLKNTKE